VWVESGLSALKEERTVDGGHVRKSKPTHAEGTVKQKNPPEVGFSVHRRWISVFR
jgi:hypothetical protein